MLRKFIDYYFLLTFFIVFILSVYTQDIVSHPVTLGYYIAMSTMYVSNIFSRRQFEQSARDFAQAAFHSLLSMTATYLIILGVLSE